MIQVLKTGAGISFQDRGRIFPNSWLEFGVPPAGPIDPQSAQLANELAHNLPNDTLLEIMLGGTEIEVLEDCYLAHVGTLGSKELPAYTGRWFRKGSTLGFSPSLDGAFSYLAVTGGWHAPKQFGSSSYHQRSNTGLAISNGDNIGIENPSANLNKHPRFSPYKLRRNHRQAPQVRLFPGPHAQLFPESSLSTLASIDWNLSPRSDRSGYRLESPNSPLQHELSLSSTPTLVGSIQVLTTGQLIATLNDGPSVGGYPIIARIHPDDLGWLTQQHAHSTIHFQLT